MDRAEANSTNNSTLDSSDYSIYLTEFMWIVILPIFTTLGNLLVVAAIGGTNRLRRKATNRLILSLAISDLCIGVFIMPLAIVKLIYNGWPLPRMVCHFFHATDVFASTASICMNFFLPFESKLTKKGGLKFFTLSLFLYPR